MSGEGEGEGEGCLHEPLRRVRQATKVLVRRLLDKLRTWLGVGGRVGVGVRVQGEGEGEGVP